MHDPGVQSGVILCVPCHQKNHYEHQPKREPDAEYFSERRWNHFGKVKEVRLLGYDKKLTFKQSANGLTVLSPAEMKTEAITTLKVVLK